MHSMLMIVRREYRERIMKKSFWIGTAVFPVLMVALTVGPMLLVGLTGNKQQSIALVDGTKKLYEPLVRELAEEKLKDGTPRYKIENVPIAGSLEQTGTSLEPRIRSGELFGVLTVADDIDAKNAFNFYGKTVGDIRSIAEFQGALRRAVIALRFEKQNLSVDKETVAKLIAPVDMETFEVQREGGTTKKGFMGVYFGTFTFVFILFMTVLLYGIAMMRGILEEKSSRVMEVLLGSVSPSDLMTGKIIGIGLVGLTQVAIYLVTAGALRLFLMTKLSGNELSGVISTFTPAKLGLFLVFFFLGYFMYVALFACIGAVCNSEQEAQNLQAPVQMCLMLPMMATIFFVGHPDSMVAVVLSMTPLFAPMVMFMRICVQTPPAWQIALSIVLTAGTTWILFRAAAKVFRIGILMYGKRPTVPEIMRWARS